MAFVSNDEVNHRIVFFEVHRAVESDKRRGPLQHVAFAYETFDDLLGTYARLKDLGIQPGWAADHGVGTAFYYEDPDRNVVELNVSNYGDEWTATEHLEDVASNASASRSREDDGGAQGWRVTLGIVQACLRRRIRSSNAIRSTCLRQVRPRRIPLFTTGGVI